LRHRDHFEPGALRFVSRLPGGVQPHPDVHARVVQIQGVRVSLASVTDDGNLARPDAVEVRVMVIIDGGHCVCSIRYQLLPLGKLVTAPTDADETRDEYLAKTPCG